MLVHHQAQFLWQAKKVEGLDIHLCAEVAGGLVWTHRLKSVAVRGTGQSFALAALAMMTNHRVSAQVNVEK
jgi:hypothetical protein